MDCLTEEYIENLKEYLVMRSPSAQGYLADSQWKRTEKGLQVSLLNTGTEYLSLSFRQLPELIRSETGIPCAVELRDTSEEKAQKLAESSMKERDERLRRVTKQAT